MQLTNRYYWVIACTLFLFPLNKSQASAWVSTQSRVNGQYIGGFSWPTEENNTTRLCNATACSVAICHFSSNLAELCANPSYALSRVIVPNGATAKEMRDIFVAQNGVSGIWFTVTKLLPADTCFGVMYWQGINNTNFTGQPIPGSYCGNVPPATETCDITGDVNIDYGPINQQRVEGAIKSAPLRITCTARTSLKLTLVGNARIDLGQNGTLTSTLTLLQQDLSNGVSVTSEIGQNTFILESRLHTTGSPVVGIFNGSGVVIMSYF